MRGAYRGRGQSNGNNSDNRRAPNRVILVPAEYRRETKSSERMRIITTWKNETGCEVLPQLLSEDGSGRSAGVIVKFELFGTTEKLDKATQKIEEWIRYSVTKTSETTKWVKLPAHIPKDWYHEHMRREQNERRKKFLRDMGEDEVTVDWPQDLRGSEFTMKDAFGAGLGKLDPIRMDDEVFIKGVGLNQLEIHGADIKNARSAEQHIKVLIEKVKLTINKKMVFPKYLILDTREDSGEGVLYEKAETWWPNHTTHPIVPRLLRCAMTSSEPGDYWQDLQPAQHNEIQKEIQRALDVARYEMGTYDLSIRLGCLAMKQPVSDTGTKPDLEKFLTGVTTKKNLDFVVKHWLYEDKDGEELLARLISANHLLALSDADGAENWFPILRGTWVFQDPNASQFTSSPYVVQILWMVDEDGFYEKRTEHTKYYRLETGRTAPKENMDIKLVELGESKGWQFSLTSMIPCKMALVPTAIRRFADGTQIKPKDDTGWKQPFVDFTAGPSLRLLTGRLDKLYTFDIKKTGYKVNLTSMWYPGAKVPCWGLNVYHGDWRSLLATTEQLRQGERGVWANTLGTFLPDDGLFCEPNAPEQPSKADHTGKPLPGDGVRLLTTKLMELSQVIHQSGRVKVPDYPAIAPSPRVSTLSQESLI
ncbi:uncharacterized protein CC84DRAFT_1227927, partial [Paraphaeosphaeria sporulosa]